MTPIFLNSLSRDQYIEHQFLSPRDHHTENQLLSPNSQASSSSDSLTCHLFLNSSTTAHDQDGAFNRESHPSQLDEGDNFGSQACEDHHVERHDERGISGLKFSLWKNESYDHTNDENQVKWMSSKMRVMYRMRKTNPMKVNTLQPATGEPPNKLEDHKEPTSSSSPMGETANSNSNNSTSYNIPVRSCSDCNTTKTPLWRSGPQGPKSLCNACGIRQRKARKAMALAAAAAAETCSSSKNVFGDKPTSLKATKILHKHHKKTNNGHTTKLKKTQYSKQIHKTNHHHQLPSSSCSSPARKNRVEDFLVSLRKNLPFHGVFPHDEKEAAILLMALSCGYAPR